jgi:hypothetical protein
VKTAEPSGDTPSERQTQDQDHQDTVAETKPDNEAVEAAQRPLSVGVHGGRETQLLTRDR